MTDIDDLAFEILYNELPDQQQKKLDINDAKALLPILLDAVRYRWLRSNTVGPGMIDKLTDDYGPTYLTLKCEQELDKAIDAAMKEQGNG